MEIIRVKNAEEGGKKAFEIIKEGMNKGAKVLGLATGSTPVTLYKEMTSSDLDFSEMTSVKKRLYQMEKQKIWKQHAKSMIKSSMHIQSISKS